MTTILTAGHAARRQQGIARHLASLGRWWRQRRDKASLARLDNHVLRDIGFERDFLGRIDRLHPAATPEL